jgi:hypothetical protein
MQFFIPRTKSTETEEIYGEIKKNLVGIFHLPIEERRVFSLSYTNSKKAWYSEVGQLEEHERRYEVVAILESKQYIVFTRTPHGSPGPMILVDKAEVTGVVDFEPATNQSRK